MAEPLNRRNPETDPAIRALRERIEKLDEVQRRAVERAAYIPMSKQETMDHEDRAQRLNDLRRELLSLTRSRKSA